MRAEDIRNAFYEFDGIESSAPVAVEFNDEPLSFHNPVPSLYQSSKEESPYASLTMPLKLCEYSP